MLAKIWLQTFVCLTVGSQVWAQLPSCIYENPFCKRVLKRDVVSEDDLDHFYHPTGRFQVHEEFYSPKSTERGHYSDTDKCSPHDCELPRKLLYKNKNDLKFAKEHSSDNDQYKKVVLIKSRDYNDDVDRLTKDFDLFDDVDFPEEISRHRNSSQKEVEEHEVQERRPNRKTPNSDRKNREMEQRRKSPEIFLDDDLEDVYDRNNSNEPEENEIIITLNKIKGNGNENGRKKKAEKVTAQGSEKYKIFEETNSRKPLSREDENKPLLEPADPEVEIDTSGENRDDSASDSTDIKIKIIPAENSENGKPNSQREIKIMITIPTNGFNNYKMNLKDTSLENRNQKGNYQLDKPEDNSDEDYGFYDYSDISEERMKRLKREFNKNDADAVNDEFVESMVDQKILDDLFLTTKEFNEIKKNLQNYISKTSKKPVENKIDDNGNPEDYYTGYDCDEASLDNDKICDLYDLSKNNLKHKEQDSKSTNHGKENVNKSDGTGEVSEEQYKLNDQYLSNLEKLIRFTVAEAIKGELKDVVIDIKKTSQNGDEKLNLALHHLPGDQSKNKNSEDTNKHTDQGSIEKENEHTVIEESDTHQLKYDNILKADAQVDEVTENFNKQPESDNLNEATSSSNTIEITLEPTERNDTPEIIPVDLSSTKINDDRESKIDNHNTKITNGKNDVVPHNEERNMDDSISKNIEKETSDRNVNNKYSTRTFERIRYKPTRFFTSPPPSFVIDSDNDVKVELNKHPHNPDDDEYYPTGMMDHKNNLKYTDELIQIRKVTTTYDGMHTAPYFYNGYDDSRYKKLIVTKEARNQPSSKEHGVNDPDRNENPDNKDSNNHSTFERRLRRWKWPERQ